LADATSLAAFIDEVRPRIEDALKQHLPRALFGTDSVFNEALHDAVFPGGRRFRATLALLASELVLANDDDALTAAVAVEYLHSCALIFDDLPGMDDARERRGRACLHLRYGEGLAMVVALALMNAAYNVVLKRASPDTAAGHRAFRELTECVAAQITGQAADLELSSTQTSVEQSSDGSVRHWKTSALVRLAVTLGPTLSGAKSRDVAALGSFGQLLGEAYQTIDDSRDVDEDAALMQRGRGATFAMQCGCEPAKERAANLTAQAQRDLVERFGDPAPVYRLCEFANLLTQSF
jgi:geranylgeranyl pyrophosphate synthase